MSNRSIISAISALLIAAAITGCAAKPQTLYNYGGYSHTYYQLKKENSPEQLVALQEEIVKLIQSKNNSTTGRVPPGIYANLGYIYLQQGDPNKAVENFKMEMEIYPESKQFMEIMINKVETAEGKGHN